MILKDMAYSIIDNAPMSTHFAAVNSGGGFVSYFPQVFGNERIKKRYVIKGGPGTGKSSFMRRVAEYAEARGRDVEYYRCSSDPASLDGIIVDRTVAVFDGTAPHVYEPRLIGVQDNIVNLCEFWDHRRLEGLYGEISRLSEQRGVAYSKVYGYLSAAERMKGINDALTSSALDREKMRVAAERLLRQIGRGDAAFSEYAIVNAIGMSGLTHISSFEKRAKRLYLVSDGYGLGWSFLSEIVKGGAEKRARALISYDPLEPKKPDGVYFPDEGVAFLLDIGHCPDGAVKVNMSRFINEGKLLGVKSEYRRNRRMCDNLIGCAISALAEAGRYHFELEDVYKSCMDFEAESAYTETFCREYFG